MSVVSSITFNGQTVTVNATAHGLVASQGFSLSGTAPTFNSTIKTVTTNSFTFALPATGPQGALFTSGYTAVQAAKQIIKLSSVAQPLAGKVTLNYLMWFTTSLPIPPAGVDADGNPLASPSQWPLASAAELAALAAGTTVEFPGTLTIPAATSAASAQTQVEAQYNTMQAAYANFLMAGNGYWWNGTAWVNQ